jgi:TolA-binding protein
VLFRSDSLKGDSVGFLHAQLLLNSGQVQRGLDELRKVTEGQYHRADAALILGSHMLAQGDTGKAEAWFQLAAKAGSGEARQQALYELAELARLGGSTDQAGQILASMNEGYWAAIGYLNLSTDFAQNDLNPARALVSLRVALAMAEKDKINDRKNQLTSRLLVRAGYLAFKDKDYEKAIGFLEKVPLDSYNTPEALYLHGLALAERGNFRSAMQSWHRAKKYPLAYPGVADAWIGMGRGYDLSGYLGQAGEAYLAANSAYEGERVTLRKLAEKIRTDGAYKTLVADVRHSDLEWFLADSRTLVQPRMAYLLEFLESPQSQVAISRVAELKALGARLGRQISDLTVFVDALKEQLGNLSHRNSRTYASGLIQKQETLQQTLEKLSSAATSVQQKQRLSALGQTLESTGSRLSNLGDRITDRPAALRLLREQAVELRAVSKHYLAATVRLADRAESILDDLALAFVAQQDQRMMFALDKTEQQIAHLYEYLALEKLDEGKP